MMGLQFVKQNTLNKIMKLYPDKSIKKHLLEVANRSTHICKLIGYEYSRTIEFACLLHDIGIVDGKENHNITGARRCVDFLKSINNEYDFSKAEVISIMQNIEMHRSTYKPDCKNPYFPLEAQIVNLADREYDHTKLSSDELYNTILLDSLIYTLQKSNNIELAIENTYTHLNKKYGIGGYGYSNPLINRMRSVSLMEVFYKNLKNKSKFELDAYIMIVKYNLVKESA